MLLRNKRYLLLLLLLAKTHLLLYNKLRAEYGISGKLRHLRDFIDLTSHYIGSYIMALRGNYGIKGILRHAGCEIWHLGDERRHLGENATSWEKDDIGLYNYNLLRNMTFGGKCGIEGKAGVYGG